MPPILKIFAGNQGCPSLYPFSCPHPLHRPPAFFFFFVHSFFFSESQINSVFDVRRLPARSLRNSGLAGGADGRAGCRRTNGPDRDVPTRVSFPKLLTASWGQGSGGGDGEAALPCPRPGSSPLRPKLPGQLEAVSRRRRQPAEGRACWPVGVSAASLDAPGGADARLPPRAPRTPLSSTPHPPPRLRESPRGRTGHSTPGASSPANGQLRSAAQGYVRADGQWGERPRPVDPRGPRWVDGPQGRPRVPPLRLRESARTPGPEAGAREPAARPRIYIFPSLGSGVGSCILMRS